MVKFHLVLAAKAAVMRRSDKARKAVASRLSVKAHKLAKRLKAAVNHP